MGRILARHRPEGVLAAAFIFVVSVVPALAAHARLDYDSASYLAAPSLTSGRLPLVAAVYAAAGHQLRVIVVVQALAGAVAWGALALEVAETDRRLARAVALVGVTAVASSTYVVQWYSAVLSDSLSLTLLVAAAALVARRQRLGGSAWPAVAVAAAWAFTRTPNCYLAAVAGLGWLAWTVARRQRAAWIPAAALLLAGVTASWVAGSGELWEQPFLHSLSERILPDPGFTAFFAARGMPVTPALRHLAGPYVPATDQAYRAAADLAGFRAWMHRAGQRSYVEFLLQHPGWALRGTFGAHEELSATSIRYYGGGVARPWYPAPLRDLLLSGRQAWLIALVAVDALAMGVAAVRRAFDRRALIWAAFVVAGCFALIIDWTADSWEVGRHSVGATVQIVVAGLVLLTRVSAPTAARGQPALQPTKGRAATSASTSPARTVAGGETARAT